MLFCFSVAASLIGATGPLPRAGFDRYTVSGAWHNFTHPTPPPPVMSPLAVGDPDEPLDP